MVHFKYQEDTNYQYKFVNDDKVFGRSTNTMVKVTDSIYSNVADTWMVFEPQVDILLNDTSVTALIRKLEQYKVSCILILHNKFCSTSIFENLYDALIENQFNVKFIKQEGHRVNQWYLYDNYGAGDCEYEFVEADIYFESSFVFFAEDEPEDEKSVSFNFIEDNDEVLFEKLVASVKYHDEIFQFRFAHCNVPKLIDAMDIRSIRVKIKAYFGKIFSNEYFEKDDGFKDIRNKLADRMENWIKTYKYAVVYSIDKLPVQVGNGERYGCCDVVEDFAYYFAGMHISFGEGHVYINKLLTGQYTAKFKVPFETARDIMLSRKAHMIHSMEIISVIDADKVKYFNQFHESSSDNYYGIIPVCNLGVSSMFEKSIPFTV